MTCHQGCLLAVALFSVCLALVRSCTIIELSSAGFVSNSIGLLHAIPMFHKQNGTLFIDNTDFNYKCDQDGGWHDFFSNEEHLVPWSAPKEQAAGQACARYSLQRVEELMSQTVQTKADLLDFIGIKLAWRYRPWVQEHVDEELGRLREQEHPTIAFHIRGGDMTSEDKRQGRATTTPLETVQTFAQTYPLIRGGTCVVIGDEHGRVTEAAKAAERHLKCKTFRTSPYWRKDGFSQEAHNKEGFDVKCGGTLRLLVDLELLAHSDYLVASDHSKWARLLQYMRYVLYDHDRSSYVDASEQHTDLYSAIRKYIRPDSFRVHHEGHHKDEKVFAVEPPARKKKNKAPHPQAPPPPPALEDEEGYDYEDEILQSQLMQLV